MLDTNPPGKRLIHLGRVTHCCGWHKPGDWCSCCNPDDCVPCCPACPNCPGPVLQQGFRREWEWIGGMVAAAIYAAEAFTGSRPS